MKSSCSTSSPASKPSGRPGLARAAGSRPAPRVVVLSHSLNQAQSLAQDIEQRMRGHLADSPDRVCLASDRVDPAVGGELWLLLGVPQTGDASELQALQAHRVLRQALHERAQSFEVLRGSAAEQLHQALSALSRWLPELRPEGAQTLAPWHSWCENCDDPDCERRLFAALEKDGPAQGVSVQPGRARGLIGRTGKQAG